MKPITINCFGTLHIQIDGQEKNNLATDRARALLAYLIANPSQPHRREKLAAFLWPERSESAARQNLRKTLSRLRQGFAPYKVLVSDYKTVRLDPQQLQTDLWRCEALLSDGKLDQAAAVYKGEFLQGFYLTDSTALMNGFCWNVNCGTSAWCKPSICW